MVGIKNQDGMSILELSVVVGLLSLVGYFVGQFMGSLQNDMAAKKVRGRVEKNVEYVIKKFDRDMKLRDPSDSLSAHCSKKKQCRGVKFNVATKGISGHESVTYETVCPNAKAAKPMSKSEFHKKSGSSNPHLDNGCLKKVECDSGGWPGLALLPIKNKKDKFLFNDPFKKEKGRYRELASAFCFDILDGNKLRMTLEVLIKEGEKKDRLVRKTVTSSLYADDKIRRIQVYE